VRDFREVRIWGRSPEKAVRLAAEVDGRRRRMATPLPAAYGASRRCCVEKTCGPGPKCRSSASLARPEGQGGDGSKPADAPTNLASSGRAAPSSPLTAAA
jgi:hypothetical protein